MCGIDFPFGDDALKWARASSFVSTGFGPYQAWGTNDIGEDPGIPSFSVSLRRCTRVPRISALLSTVWESKRVARLLVCANVREMRTTCCVLSLLCDQSIKDMKCYDCVCFSSCCFVLRVLWFRNYTESVTDVTRISIFLWREKKLVLIKVYYGSLLCDASDFWSIVPPSEAVVFFTSRKTC